MPVSQQEERETSTSLADHEVYRFGSYRLDVQECRLWHDETSIPLPPKTFDTLHVLVQNAGLLIDKKTLLQAVWPDTFVEEGNLSVHISALRKTFGRDHPECEFIETVPRRGYRFLIPVVRNVSVSSLQTGATMMDVPRRLETVLEEERPPLLERLSALLPIRRLSVITLLVSLSVAFVVFHFFRHGRVQREQGHLMSDSRPLTSEPGTYAWPTFSPDGRSIAYSWRSDAGRSRVIFIQKIGRDDREALTEDDEESFSPTWSPNGHEIAFLQTTQDRKWLEIKVADVQKPHTARHLTLINNIKSAFHDVPTLNWSPDGSWLVTSEKDDANQSSPLKLISVAHGDKRSLTAPPPMTVDVNAVFSPHGEQIAYVRAKGPSSSEIHIVPVGGGPDRILPFPIHSISGLTWDADGKSLLVASSRALSVGNLWRLPVDGSAPVALSALPAHIRDPIVSPQGHRLAYIDLLRNGSLWRMSLDGSDKQEQLIASRFIDSAPDYSPDGTQIAFESDRTGASEIWVCRSDGTQCKRITDIFGANTSSPRWSPDGKRLAFNSGFKGRSAIFMVDASGGPLTRLTTGAFETADNLVPNWSHDGVSIYFSSDRTGRFEVWSKKLRGGEERQITRRGGFAGMESSDGKDLYYVEDTNVTTISRISLASGEGKQVAGPLGTGMWGYWTIVANSMYYLKRTAEGVTPATAFRLNLKTGAQSRIGQTQLGINQYDKGLTVSPDERWLVYAQRDVDRSSLMVSENWR